jgi:hypothetical protein
MDGHYYKLGEAINHVSDYISNEKARERLIDALELVNNYGSISTTLKTLYGEDRVEFYKSLRKLSAININPVTIPNDWNIEFIRNLLDASINGYLY